MNAGGARSKPKKLALTACMRTRLVILGAIVNRQLALASGSSGTTIKTVALGCSDRPLTTS